MRAGLLWLLFAPERIALQGMIDHIQSAVAERRGSSSIRETALSVGRNAPASLYNVKLANLGARRITTRKTLKGS